MTEIARMMILAGAFLLGVGFLVLLLAKLPGVGKLPGDILIKKENFTFYAPLGTSILLSVIISLIMYFMRSK